MLQYLCLLLLQASGFVDHSIFGIRAPTHFRDAFVNNLRLFVAHTAGLVVQLGDFHADEAALIPAETVSISLRKINADFISYINRLS